MKGGRFLRLSRLWIPPIGGIHRAELRHKSSHNAFQVTYGTAPGAEFEYKPGDVLLPLWRIMRGLSVSTGHRNKDIVDR